MKGAMKPLELVSWRRDHRLNQTETAAFLGRSRASVVNWERGHTPIPAWVPGKLLEHGRAPAKAEALTFKTTRTRSDLLLYTAWAAAGGHGYECEHPHWLLPNHPQPFMTSVLDSDEYKAALVEHRATCRQRPADAATAARPSLWDTIVASTGVDPLKD